MGLFDFLKRTADGGGQPSTPEEREAAEHRRRFETLRDDGVRAMSMGEAAFASKCLNAALELEPDDLKTVGYMAECLLRMQEDAAALPHLERLAQAEPANLEVRLLLARTQGKTGDFTAMRATCQALQADFPEEPRAAYYAAEAAHGDGDDFTAIALLTSTLQGHEDYEAARLLRARILADMGQWAEVLADTAVLVAADGENGEYLLLHGNALAATGRGEEAAEAFSTALQHNPFDREATLRLGHTLEAEGIYDRALAVYDEAISLQPDFAEAYKRRGGVKLALHDEAGAADDLKRSLELKPELAEGIDGEYSNMENRMNAQYRAMNPYGF